MTRIGQAFKKLGGSLKKSFRPTANVFRSGYKDVSNSAKKTGGTLKKGFTKAGDKIKLKAISTGNKIKKTAQDKFQEVRKSKAMKDIHHAIRNASKVADDAGRQLKQHAKSIATSVGKELAVGAAGLAGDLVGGPTGGIGAAAAAQTVVDRT
jgi:hypothetical protein